MCLNRGAVYGFTAAWGSRGKGYITVFCMPELKHGDMQKCKEIKATELYRFAGGGKGGAEKTIFMS